MNVTNSSASNGGRYQRKCAERSLSSHELKDNDGRKGVNEK
jgi:hypothetical protein